MDQQFYHQPYNPAPPRDRRSHSMEPASLILGTIAVVTCSCLYISITCGALAVILGLLSKGGEHSMGGKAKAGVTLGILGLVFTIALIIASFAFVISYYGSLEGMLQAYCEMTGMDYNELYQMLFSTSP